MNKVLKDEYIREAAYFIWEKEGCPESDGYEFWMKAIEQLSDCKADFAAEKKTASKKTATSKTTSVKAAAPAKKASVVKKVAVKKLSVKK